MKAILLFLLFVCSTLDVLCQPVTQLDYLNYNNMNGSLLSDGILFYDPVNSAAGLEVPKGSGKSIVYSASLWMAGINVLDSAVYLAESTFGSIDASFNEGPVANNYNTSYDLKYKRLWKINKIEIDNHRILYNTTGYQVPQIIAQWPAHGDTTNGEAFYLAPFIDINYNGIYEPQLGDYPCIKGDEAIYIIYNSERNNFYTYNLIAEVHLMAYSYGSGDQLGNVIFLEYKIINRSNKTFTDLCVGKWVDFDIGCANDDFIGCDTNLNFFYAYNGDNIDEDCSGATGYQSNPPAAGVIVLDQKMHSFMSYNRNGVWYRNDPVTEEQYYGYLNAIWKDGFHVVTGGNGYPTDSGATSTQTNFMFNGEPSDTNTWTEIAVGNVPFDRRGLGSIRISSFAPGDTLEVSYGVIYSRNPLKDHIANVVKLKSDVQFVQNFFNITKHSCAEIVIGVEAQPAQNLVSIYPNPAKDQLNFKVENGNLEMVELYNNLGQMVLSQRINGLNTFEMNVSDLPRSMYFVRLTVEGETVVRRVMIE